LYSPSPILHLIVRREQSRRLTQYEITTTGTGLGLGSRRGAEDKLGDEQDGARDRGVVLDKQLGPKPAPPATPTPAITLRRSAEIMGRRM
jgi:hypothetical protein